MTRCETQLYPTYTAEIEYIRENGINAEILQKIIQKHLPNSEYNRYLYRRYEAIYGGVPIFDRQPRYEEEENPINNKVNNDFFSEIIDFKVGYFAGEPIAYSYADTKESEESTGGDKGIDIATETLTDFTTRNNMYGVDMETTKNATIYGYSGRLFYHDKEGAERAMPVHGFETIILSDTTIAEPEYGVRYFEVQDIDGVTSWTVEFYDDKYIHTYKGELMSLQLVDVREHYFDYCPLQGIANNSECMGDAEKVLNLIDDYDKVVSDNSNEIEAFVHALLLVNLHADDEDVKKAQKSGSLIIPPTGTNQNSDPVKWLTKQINDAFTEHHLERLESNIYRFAKTPNMNNEAFSTASGQALKFRLHSLETKCASFEANVMNAAQHMWRVLCSSWNKKGKQIDPLQFVMDFKRNFPRMELDEAQTAQALKNIGLPDEIVYSRLSFIDDVDYVLEVKKKAQEDAMSLYAGNPNMLNQQNNNNPVTNEEDDDDGVQEE